MAFFAVGTDQGSFRYRSNDVSKLRPARMRPGFRGCRGTNGFLCLIRVDILSILIGGLYYEIITTTDRPTSNSFIIIRR